MKIPSSGEKPNNLLDLVSNSSEAVKVSTKSTANQATTNPVAVQQANEHSAVANQIADDKATTVKFGLAKYLAEELDPKKVIEERKAKIAALKAQVENGTYLNSVSSEGVAQKLLENSQLENLIYGNAANDE